MTPLHLARKVLRRVGIEAFRANPMTTWDLRLPQYLTQHGVETVLDVGANNGGYATSLIAGGYKGNILSFEPLPAAWLQLKRKSNRHTNWSVAPAMALSSANGEAEFHEAGNSVSSSLLEMADSHVAAAPQSRIVSRTKVQTRRLDDVLRETRLPGPYFLKLDVQGAERLVLDGAQAALSGSVVGVELEMSLTALYDGQPTADELHEFLRSKSFRCWDILPGFRDPSSFRMLQYDGIYFRER